MLQYKLLELGLDKELVNLDKAAKELQELKDEEDAATETTVDSQTNQPVE
jgi:hypothetical protein